MIDIKTCYPILPSLLRKFDRNARKDCFSGKTKEDFEQWKTQTRLLIRNLLGLDKMETCDLNPIVETITYLPEGIRREHIRIQVEPDVWMPMFVLIPDQAGKETRPFLCPPGHNGAGKYTVAGLAEYRMVAEKIHAYQYDYGYQLARLGYVAVCPDCRGFGERREKLESAEDPDTVMGGDCYWLAHMGEPLGIPVAGMLTWDLMCVIDYLEARGNWDTGAVSCLGFSGGGMQTMWLSALDDRIKLSVISGYLYGYRNALLTLYQNCSCNYVPHLWEHLDMGDIVSLIAPRPLLIQSCREDRLNGSGGMANVEEQVQVVQRAYACMDVPELMIHEICEGGHQWHGENLEKHLRQLLTYYHQYQRNQEVVHE